MQCPFCRNLINEGATVCTGCGAYYYRAGRVAMASLRFLFGSISATAGAVIGLLGSGWMRFSGLSWSMNFLILATIATIGTWIALKPILRKSSLGNWVRDTHGGRFLSQS